MPQPHILILRAPGINCDEETAHAWRIAGATAEALHVQRLLDSPALLDQFAALTIPGGFSYGDDIASGKILATQIARRLADPLHRFVQRGGLVLGICNGFQVLVKAGLLPGGDLAGRLTLTHNDSGRYEDRWVFVQSATNHCAFVRPGQRLRLPVAHGEGKLVADSPDTLAILKTRDHIALQYCDAEGRTGSFPINPNGSQADIAGLTDSTGRVFGLMPHPERAIEPTQLPDWTRTPLGQQSPAPGLTIFKNAVAWLQDSAAARAGQSIPPTAAAV